MRKHYTTFIYPYQYTQSNMLQVWSIPNAKIQNAPQIFRFQNSLDSEFLDSRCTNGKAYTNIYKSGNLSNSETYLSPKHFREGILNRTTQDLSLACVHPKPFLNAFQTWLRSHVQCKQLRKSSRQVPVRAEAGPEDREAMSLLTFVPLFCSQPMVLKTEARSRFKKKVFQDHFKCSPEPWEPDPPTPLLQRPHLSSAGPKSGPQPTEQ